MKFSNLSRKFLSLAIVAFFSVPSLMAQEHWKLSVNQYGLREVWADSKSVILGVPRQTRLHFMCTQDGKGSTGYLSMHFMFSDSSNISGFDLGYFDGPGAPVGLKKLMTITLIKAGKRTRFQVGLSGTGTSDLKDGYTFETGTPTKNKNGYMRKVVSEILTGAESIEVAVVDGHDPSKAITASFLLMGGRECFEGMMKGIK